VPIELEAGWTPEPVWTFRRREKLLSLLEFEPRTVYPVVETLA